MANSRVNLGVRVMKIYPKQIYSMSLQILTQINLVLILK